MVRQGLSRLVKDKAGYLKIIFVKKAENYFYEYRWKPWALAFE